MNKIFIFIISFAFFNAAPESFDWRNYNLVTPVKDSTSMGSSWALTLANHLEALYAKHHGIYVGLSERMLLDCCINENNFSLKLMEITFQWLIKNGIMRESDYNYPYTGLKGTCKFDINKSVMKIIGYKKIGNALNNDSCADEEEIKEYLVENGPLIVAFNANPLQTYSSGILDLSSAKCSEKIINHTGLLIGYGSSLGIDYWIVKNTWGKSWGESGYFRIRRGKGTCGINCNVICAKVAF